MNVIQVDYCRPWPPESDQWCPGEALRGTKRQGRV